MRTNFARQTNLLPEYELPDVDNRDLLLLIQLAVEKMPGQRQRIFRMSREEGIANDEIARRLGISTRTVENQISRALSELRKLVTLIDVYKRQSSFRENVLSKGGTEHPMELYVRFRGHKPETRALIEKMGLGK